MSAAPFPVTVARTWADAVADARVRSAIEDRPMAVVPDPFCGLFDVVVTSFLRPDDWDLVAVIVDPDPDLAAMLASCPVDADAVAAFRAALTAAVPS